jgi:phenylpropionate dioxygenase-like ring-hydroxylating dioxygenase large terminal subunit
MATTAMPRDRADEYCGPPKAWFLSENWSARDLEAVFVPRWLVAGHLDELDAEGEHGFLTFSLGAHDVFIRRDETGTVRAFHNACPHRGARLCDARSGTAATKRVVCPYHQWTFGVEDGRLINSRQMHADFDPAPYHLKPAHVDVWNGLIFVCFADERPRPLDEHFAAVSSGELAAGFDLSGMKLAATACHEIKANWKIVVDNNLECYHCAVNHPELSELVDWRFIADDTFDAFCAERADGLEVFGFPLPSPQLSIDAARVCRVPIPRLPGSGEATESRAIHWEPGVAMVVSGDNAWLFVPRPLGPGRTELRQYWFVARDAVAGADYEVDTVKEFWMTTMLQDLGLCERVHQGMANPAYEAGPLNRIHQGYNAGFYRWYEEVIGARYPEVLSGC